MEFGSIDLFLLAVIAFGAATQRVTGIGFSLICAPFVVLRMHDPLYGVLVVNVLCILLNFSVLAQTWRNVDIRSIAILSIAALITVPFGQWAVVHTSRNILMIAVGVIVLFGLFMLLFPRCIPKLRPSVAAVIAGCLSGFMNVVSGVGGPPIALYAAAQKWEQRTFVASAQLFFLMVNIASVFVENPMRIHPGQVLILAISMLLGSVAGNYAAKIIKPSHARAATLLIAALGALGVFVKGVAGLWHSA